MILETFAFLRRLSLYQELSSAFANQQVPCTDVSYANTPDNYESVLAVESPQDVAAVSITNSELGCNFCEYVSKSTSDLKTHDQIVHKLPLVDIKAAYNLSCNLCNYVCRLNIQLKHSSEGQFPCDKCNSVTYSLEASKHHSITDHNSEVIEPEIDKHDFDTLSKQVQSLEKQLNQ